MATATQAPARQRAAASGVTLTVEGMPLMQIPVDLVPQARPNRDVSFPMVCPDCDTPTKPSQRYLCPNGHGPFHQGQLLRGVEVDKDDLRFVDSTEVDAVRGAADGKKDRIVFRVHPASEVAGATRPGGSGYRLRPPKKAGGSFADFYAALIGVARDPDLALVGEWVVRSNSVLFRLEEWGGQLFLSEIARPDDLAPTDEIPDGNDHLVEPLLAQLAELVEPFDPEAYANRVRGAFTELVDAKREADPTAKPTPVEVDATPDGDADAVAAALIAQLTAKPKAKKKAAAKPDDASTEAA